MFAGSLVAIVTPMRPDGAVDFAAWARLLEFHVAQRHPAASSSAARTGESATLRDAELRELTARACEQLRGRRAGDRRCGHQQHRRHASSACAGSRSWPSTRCCSSRPPTTARRRRACTSTSPPPPPPPQADPAVQRARAHGGGHAARDRGAAGARCAASSAVKEAVPEAARVRELVGSCPRDFVVLSGDDATAREAIAAGARGVISVTANVAPRAMSEMVAAALRGEAARAAQLDAPLERAAPGAVRRGESDPGQVAADADGTDRSWDKIAAHAAAAEYPRARARGGARRRDTVLKRPRRSRVGGFCTRFAE